MPHHSPNLTDWAAELRRLAAELTGGSDAGNPVDWADDMAPVIDVIAARLEELAAEMEEQ